MDERGSHERSSLSSNDDATGSMYFESMPSLRTPPGSPGTSGTPQFRTASTGGAPLIKRTTQAVIWAKKASNGSQKWVEECTEEQFAWYVVFKKSKTWNRIAVICLLALTCFESPAACLGTHEECAHANHYVYSWHLPIIPLRLRMIIALCLYSFIGWRFWVRSRALGAAYEFGGMVAFQIVLVSVGITSSLFTLASGFQGSLTYVVSVLCRPLVYVACTKRLKQPFYEIGRSLSCYLDVLASLFLTIFVFIWMGMVLFTGTPEGSVDFFSWGDGFAKMWILFTTSNDPDVWVPAYSSNKFNFFFFFIFLVITLYLLSNVLLAKVYDAFKNILIEDTKLQAFNRKESMAQAWRNLADAQVGQQHIHHVISKRTWMEFFHEYCNPYYGTIYVGDTEAKAYNYSRCAAILAAAGIELGDVTGKRFTITHGQFDNIMTLVLDRGMFIPSKNKLSTEDQDSQPQEAISWWTANRKRLRQFFLEGTDVNGFHLQWDAMVDCLIFVGIIVTFWASVSFVSGKATQEIKTYASFWILFAFSCLYTLGISTKIFSLGFERFWNRRRIQHRFDFFNIYALIIVELLFVLVMSNEFLERIIIILHMARGLRLVVYVTPLREFFETITKLARTFKVMVRVLFVVFYVFAILGQYCFGGLIYTTNPVLAGTNFASAGYWPLNFNDLLSGMVTLFALMIVNNWYELAQGYMLASHTNWAAAYFLAFFIVCNLIVLNILIALIIDCISAAESGDIEDAVKTKQDDLEAGEGLGQLRGKAMIQKLVGVEDEQDKHTSTESDEDDSAASDSSSESEKPADPDVTEKSSLTSTTKQKSQPYGTFSPKPSDADQQTPP